MAIFAIPSFARVKINYSMHTCSSGSREEALRGPTVYEYYYY